MRLHACTERLQVVEALRLQQSFDAELDAQGSVWI